MRIVFLGSPEFALPALEGLHGTHEVVLVVTQPPRPCGRGQKCMPTPVWQLAQKLGLETIAPKAVRTEAFAQRIRDCRADYLVVVAYGRILPPEVLEAARFGALNIHPSLLPRHRGPAPVPWTLWHGDPVTGVTIMQMNEFMDAGDIVRQIETPVQPDENADELLHRLAVAGTRELLDVLAREEAGNRLPRTPQDPSRATTAPLLTTEMAWVDWDAGAQTVANRIRAFDSKPGAYTFLSDVRLKVFRPAVLENAEGEPGSVLGTDAGRLVVACAQGAVALGELQWPGSRRMPAAHVLAGHPIPMGTKLRGRGK